MPSNTPVDERIALLHSLHRRAAPSRLPDRADVMRELERIVRSQAFRQASKLQDLLRFLVEETLAGRAGGLTATSIAKRVFGKGPGFKSSEDPVVRVAANRLRTALALNSLEGAKTDIQIVLEPRSYVPVLSYRTTEDGPGTIRDVLQRYTTYLAVSSARTHSIAYRSVLEAIRSHPDDVELQTVCAVLAIDTYLHGYGESPSPVDQAWPVLEQARTFAPANPLVQFSSGFLALTQGDLPAAEQYGRELLLADSEDEALAAQGAWLIAMTLDPRDVDDFYRVDLSETDEHPGWMHHPRFLASYQAGDYEGALAEAIAFGMPQFFWGPLERAAALAQLGLRDAAKREIRRAAALNPHLARNPTLYLKFYIPHPDTLEHVCEGLEKAGLHRMAG